MLETYRTLGVLSLLIFASCSKKQPVLPYLQKALNGYEISDVSSNNATLIEMNNMIKGRMFFVDMLRDLNFEKFDYLLVNPFLRDKNHALRLKFPETEFKFIQYSSSFIYDLDGNQFWMNLHYLTESIDKDECYTSNKHTISSNIYNDQWYQIFEDLYQREMTYAYKANKSSSTDRENPKMTIKKDIKSKKINDFFCVHLEKFEGLNKKGIIEKVNLYSSYSNIYISNIFIIQSNYDTIINLLDNEDNMISNLNEDNYTLEILYYSLNLQRVIDYHTVKK